MYIESEKAERLWQLINAYETVIIHRHQRPDPDAIGSQLGLKYLLNERFPQKRVLAAGTTTQGLAWLGDMDKVTGLDYQEALVIVCDTANQPRIDGDLYGTGAVLVKIDHHPVVDEYGDLQIVYPQASSTCEIIAELSRYYDERLPLTTEAATLLYTGMVTDTGRFLFSSTTDLTHEVAARLLKYEFDAFAINDRFMTLTLAEAKFQAFAFEQMEMFESGVGRLIIRQEDMERFEISEEQSNVAIGVLGRIEGIKSWAVFVQQQGESVYRVRLRSKGPAINEIAALHGGGGHPMASGAYAYTQEEMDQIVKELQEAVLTFE